MDHKSLIMNGFIISITERIEECVRWGDFGSTWAPRSTKEAKMQVPLSHLQAHVLFLFPLWESHITLHFFLSKLQNAAKMADYFHWMQQTEWFPEKNHI